MQFFSQDREHPSSVRRENHHYFINLTSNLTLIRNGKIIERFHKYLLKCEDKGFPRAGKNLLFYIEVIKFKVSYNDDTLF